jgi:hypothetical protein
MKAIVFHTSTDRKGRHDATGAFVPEAKAFAKIHGVAPSDMIAVPQNIPVWDRRGMVRYAFRAQASRGVLFDAVVYFGHGTKTSLPGLGYREAQLRQLAALIRGVLRPGGHVVLYACSSGKGYGFADKLDQAIEDSGLGPVKTVAHLTAGHVSINPHTEYSGEGPTLSGVPIIAPTDP